jgi:predicted transposase/invertase (TIGR01784 family)
MLLCSKQGLYGTNHRPKGINIVSMKINNPHDKFFKKAMSDQRVAKEFFEHHLPQIIQEKMDFGNLTFCKQSFIGKELAAHEADVLYKTNFNEQPGYLYILAEHQSTIDKLMPFRLARYMLKVIGFHLDQHGQKNLPIVYPLVFYHGQQKHPEPTDFFSLYGDEAELVRKIWNSPYHLIDVSKSEDQDLQKRTWSGTMEFIFKHIFERELEELITKIRSSLITIAQNKGDEYIGVLLYYILNQAEPESFRKIKKALNEPSQPPGGYPMKLGDIIRNEGFKEGIEQGIEQGKKQANDQINKKLARKLLEKGMDAKTVAELLDLSLDTVRTL